MRAFLLIDYISLRIIPKYLVAELTVFQNVSATILYYLRCCLWLSRKLIEI